MNNITVKKITKINNIASIVCATLHIPIALYNINKHWSVTKKEAISLFMDGIIVGYSLYKLENYLDMKLEELTKEMGEEE